MESGPLRRQRSEVDPSVMKGFREAWKNADDTESPQPLQSWAAGFIRKPGVGVAVETCSEMLLASEPKEITDWLFLVAMVRGALSDTHRKRLWNAASRFFSTDARNE